jgi:hypothetical protein
MTPLSATNRSSPRNHTRTMLKCHMRPKGAMILISPAYGMPFQDASLDQADLGGTPEGPVRSTDWEPSIGSARDRAVPW